MSGTLMVHAGGWTAEKADLAAVPVPEETPSYFPVAYDRFVEEVALHVPRLIIPSDSARRFRAKTPTLPIDRGH